MTDIDNSLVLQDLRKEIIVREIIEKTKNDGLTWTHDGGNTFSSSATVGTVVWSFYIQKTQIGSTSYRYNLDIRMDGAAYLSMVDGPLMSSSRESQTKDLYDTVELKTLQLDLKAMTALQAIQSILSCADSLP